MSGIITYHRASGCAVNITGGTETGHASGKYSHASGNVYTNEGSHWDIVYYTCGCG